MIAHPSPSAASPEFLTIGDQHRPGLTFAPPEDLSRPCKSYRGLWRLLRPFRVFGLLDDVVHHLSHVPGQVIERGHHLGSVRLQNVNAVA